MIVERFLNSTTRIASPIAASAAATVRMKNTKICPAPSPRKWLNATKFMLTASSISSIDMRRMMTFFRLRKIPTTARQNRSAPSPR